MKDQQTEVLKLAYDAGANDEYERLTTPNGKIEFSKVCSAIEKYTKHGDSIYDIGCGPGRYTEYLISKGYFVGGVDLSQKSLAMFDERLHGSKSEKLLFSKACCASELNWIDPDSADTILLLGPMYHITDEKKRKSVISHCHRILKNGGYLISMFLSPYPVFFPQNKEKTTLVDISEKDNCIITTTRFKGFIVPQYRCWPKNARSEFRPRFTEIEIVHIDEIKDADLDTSSSLHVNDQYSHQYFIVFRKRIPFF